MGSQLPALRAPELPSLAELAQLGQMLSASGYFQDARDAAQAGVKVLAGAELGIPPVASMTGVNIIKGRVTLSAALMGAIVKRHPKYDYKIRERTVERAVVAFFEDGAEVGSSEFTMDDARTARLTGENWQKYPRNMLFWRALSNGALAFCPDAFAGAPVYTPEELGAEVDPETGEILEAPVRAGVDPRDMHEDELAASPRRRPVKIAAPASPTSPAQPPSPTQAAPSTEPEEGPPPVEPPAADAATDAEGRPDTEPPPVSEPANGDALITEKQVEILREFLHRLGTREGFWRMGLLSLHKADLGELTQAEAHDLMERAKADAERRKS